MKHQKALLLAGLLAALPFGMAHAGPAPEIDNLIRDLNDLPWVQYGDARSYSLPVSTFYYQNLTGTNVDPYKVAISDANKGVFVFKDEGGTRTLPGMENPYDSVTSNTDTFSATVPYNYQGIDGSVTTQLSNAWDIEVSTLKTYLTFNNELYAPVFYFQNNQINNMGSFNQSLAAWARVWVTDNTGATVGSYLFTNDLSPYKLVSEGGGGVYMGDVTTFASADAAPRSYDAVNDLTDFVLSGGAICVAYSTTNTALFPVPVSCSTTSATLPAYLTGQGYNTVSPDIAHNLGNDAFPYAVVFPELNALLAGLYDNPDGYTLHADVRIGCATNPNYPSPNGDPCTEPSATNLWGKGLNNGGESLALGGARITYTQVPEPGMLAILGIGLLGMAAMRRHNA